MTRRRLSELLYQAAYLVVRRRSPLPSIEEFLDLPLGRVLADSAPSDWPSFWEETMTSVLKDLLRRDGVRIDELGPELFARRDRTLRSIRDWMAERVMPVAPED